MTSTSTPWKPTSVNFVASTCGPGQVKEGESGWLAAALKMHRRADTRLGGPQTGGLKRTAVERQAGGSP